jgi:hypothetical protein
MHGMSKISLTDYTVALQERKGENGVIIAASGVPTPCIPTEGGGGGGGVPEMNKYIVYVLPIQSKAVYNQYSLYRCLEIL